MKPTTTRKRSQLAYVEAKFPNHHVWSFDKGREGTPFNELRALGLIELMGTREAEAGASLTPDSAG
jgi:hypothetical protein